MTFAFICPSEHWVKKTKNLCVLKETVIHEAIICSLPQASLRKHQGCCGFKNSYTKSSIQEEESHQDTEERKIKSKGKAPVRY